MATAMKYRGLTGAIIDAFDPGHAADQRASISSVQAAGRALDVDQSLRFEGVNVPVTCAGVRVIE